MNEILLTIFIAILLLGTIANGALTGNIEDTQKSAQNLMEQTHIR